MFAYIVRRLLWAIPILFLAAAVLFFAVRLMPGDPVEAKLGMVHLTSKQIQHMRETLGLDKPLLTQFYIYLKNLLHGDLGLSVNSRQPVVELILSQLPATVELNFAAMTFAVLIGLPLGVIAALHQNSLGDVVAMGGAVVGVSIPQFWLGLVLIFIFAVTLGFFPPTSFNLSLHNLVLPAITLGAAESAIIARLTRANLVEILREDYVTTAKSKGLAHFLVVYKHALRNCFIPLITMMGLQIGKLMGSAVVVESVFARPGLGTLLVNAILHRDWPLIQGCILCLAILFILINLSVDLTYALINPKIRLE